MNLNIYPDREALVLALVSQLVSELTEALHHQERAAIAVPGGSTPGPVFDALSAVHLDWARVDVVLTDERWVPESAPRSNARMVRARLLTDQAAAATLVPLYADTGTPEGGLARLSKGVRKILPLTWALLGMGADMHVASLFPGADLLSDALSSEAPPLVPIRAPGLSEPRITLSAPVLNGAMAKHLLIFGEEKRAALERAMHLPPTQAPVAALLPELDVHWAA